MRLTSRLENQTYLRLDVTLETLYTSFSCGSQLSIWPFRWL